MRKAMWAQWPVVGAPAPPEIRPLSRSGSTWGRERSAFWMSGNTLPKAQRLPQVNSPKPPPTGPTPLPPADPALQSTLPKIAQKSLQISAWFRNRFWDSFGVPKGSQNGSKSDPESLPRRSRGQVAFGTCFGSCFWCLFGAPGISKIELSHRRRATFC